VLDIGSFPARSCQGISRRTFLRAGAVAPFALSGLGSLAAESRRAKSVLLLWLWGAPSHLDTFDPKPNAPAEYRGPFGTIPTRTPGVRYAELFPKLAARSDRYTLIRSNKNFHSGHLEAGTIALTGVASPTEGVAPNFGAIVARQRGSGGLPPFIAVGRGNPRDIVGPMKGYGGGNWGKIYDPFLIGCSPEGETDVPALKLLNGLSVAQVENRRLLLDQLDRLQRQADNAELQKWEATRQRAHAMLMSPEALRALDLGREPAKTREAYGQTSFGQSCLLARRLIEAQVPYVQVNWSQYVEVMINNCDIGWDTHAFNFELLADSHGPIFDRVFATLLDDMQERGLLEHTLVIAMGEFGRTPRINADASRDHWPNCYFSIWAGAGIPPGRVIGESDKLGADPITTPITPAMVGTTILELAGVTSQARAEYRILPGGEAIHELL
jgi:uncharacterized protein (DUF1501 family)